MDKLKLGRKANTQLHKEIIEMYEQGLRDIDEFIANIPMSESSIKRVLKESGYKLPHKERDLEQVQGVCKDYAENVPIKEMLAKWKISIGTLYTILYDNEIPIRKEAQGNALRKQAAIQMYSANVPTQKILEETGVSSATLYSEIRQQNIEPRTHKDSPSINAAINMYVEGIPLNDIYAETGIHATKLYFELSRRKIQKRGKTPNQDSRVEEAIKQYSNGTSIEQIYQTTKVSPGLLYRALKLRGLNKRGHTDEVTTSESLDIAVKMYVEGETLGNIWEVTRIRSKSLYAELRQRGLELRP